MSVIMGGSGSTGSSLVKNILNRHQSIFAGEETSFFAKAKIYEQWDVAKSRIFSRKVRGLRNHGFHIYNGVDMLSHEYLSSDDIIRSDAIQSASLSEFCDCFYAPALEYNNANMWLEKTPANAACFTMFLQSFERGRVIHMIRNPYDTIASLWARGYDLYYAVGIYLLNTSSGLTGREYSDRYHEVTYEKLIISTENTVRAICDFLDVEYGSDMLHPKGEKIEVSQLSGWNHDETKEIGKQSIGRFDNLEEEIKIKIIQAIECINISDTGARYYNIKHRSIKELCEVLEYEYKPYNSKISNKRLVADKRKDRLERIRRGYITGIFYPLEIK